jgi:hypothetical protein
MLNAPAEPDFNPYAPPGTAPSGDELTDSYKLVWARMTFAECWRMSTGPLWPVVFFVLAVRKITGSRRHFRIAIPYPRQIEVIGVDEIPARAKALWQKSIEEGQARGLRLIFCYRVVSAGMTREIIAAILRSDDGLVQVSLSYQAFEIQKVLREKVTITAGSRLDDGRRFLTRNTSAYLDHPPEYVIRVAPRRPLGVVLDRHLGWIASRGWKPAVMPLDDIAGRVLEREQSIVDFQIGRGVLAPMTRREVSRLQELMDRTGSRQAVPQSRTLALLQSAELFLNLIMLVAVLGMLFTPGVVFGVRGSPLAPTVLLLGYIPVLLAIKFTRHLLMMWSRGSGHPAGPSDQPGSEP